MPGDHVEVAINQDRAIETENSDAFGNLPDLSPAMAARVRRVGFQLIDPTVLD
jgi:hypothetical protein